MQYVKKWHLCHSKLHVQGIKIHVLENELYATDEDESRDAKEKIKLEPGAAYDTTGKWILLQTF